MAESLSAPGGREAGFNAIRCGPPPWLPPLAAPAHARAARGLSPNSRAQPAHRPGSRELAARLSGPVLWREGAMGGEGGKQTPPLARLPSPHPYCAPPASTAQGAGRLPAGLCPAAPRLRASQVPGPHAPPSLL